MRQILNGIFQFPGDIICDICDFEKLDEKYDTFWHKLKSDYDNEEDQVVYDNLTEAEWNKLRQMCFQKKKLVDGMIANHLSNRQAYFRMKFNVKENPTPEMIANEVRKRLNEDFDGTDEQLHRLADHIQTELENIWDPNPRPEEEEEAMDRSRLQKWEEALQQWKEDNAHLVEREQEAAHHPDVRDGVH